MGVPVPGAPDARMSLGIEPLTKISRKIASFTREWFTCQSSTVWIWDAAHLILNDSQLFPVVRPVRPVRPVINVQYMVEAS